MHRVVEYIDYHLDGPLELDVLAAVANFSAFHFHRLFVAWMGETLGEYVRRRRLEVAAQRLAAQPRLAVTQVALAVGFGSTEAFSRAFKARFGRTPTAWRDADVSKRDQFDRNPNQAKPAPARQDGSMKVTIVDRQPTTIAYLRHVGPYGKEISDFWMHEVDPWMRTNNLYGRPRYGISLDDPGVTAPARLRYDAAVEVAPDFTGTGNYQKTVLPGGKYAVGQFQGDDRAIADAWGWIIREWLPDSGMQLDARPFFEHYPVDAKYDGATGQFECEICIPVAPL